MNFIEIIILSFSVQATILGLIFLVKKNGNKRANILWGCFLILFAYNIFYNVLYWTDFDVALKRRLALVYFIPMSLYGPLFYLYVQVSVSKKTKLTKHSLIHFIPSIVVLALYLKLYLLPLDIRDKLLKKGVFEESVIIVNPRIVYSTLAIVMFSYSIATYVKFTKEFKHCQNLQNWLRTISFCFLFFTLAWIIYDIFSYLELATPQYDYFITLFMIVFIVLTSLFAHVYPQVNREKSLTQILTKSKKYGTSGLSQSVSLEYKEKLLCLMYVEKLYLDGELQLAGLAKSLGLSRHHTSQVINEHFEMGFYDFINKFRVEEAKKLLAQNEHESKIIEIAYKSGFNNKVSFYKSFKKFIGITPSEFIQNQAE